MSNQHHRGIFWLWPVAVVLIVSAAVAWWFSQEGCRLVFLAHPGGVRAIALSVDGKWLASAGKDKQVRLWDIASGRFQNSFPMASSEVGAVALSVDGSRLAAGGSDGQIKVWNLTDHTEKECRPTHRGAVHAVVFTPDGASVFSAGVDRVILQHDCQTGDRRATLVGHTGAVQALAISPDGKTLASAGGGDRVVRIWKLPRGSPVQLLTGHTRRILALCFADQQTLLSGDRDGTIKVWDLQTGRQKESVIAHDCVAGLGCHPDSGTVVSAGEDGGLARWSLATLSDTPRRWQQRSPSVALLLFADGLRAVTGGMDGRVRVWDVPRS